MPFDPPFALPPREPERDGRVRRVLSDEAFKVAIIEVFAATFEVLGLTEPIGPQGFERITNDPVFRARLSALALATLESGA